MSEGPMILHASDEALGMMGIDALHAQARADMQTIVRLSEQSVGLHARIAEMQAALTLAERALGAVEWGEYNIGYGQYTYECVWCEAKKGKPHSPDCARQAALSAIRSVTR